MTARTAALVAAVAYTAAWALSQVGSPVPYRAVEVALAAPVLPPAVRAVMGAPTCTND